MPIELYLKSLRVICRKKNKKYFENLESITYEEREIVNNTDLWGYSSIRKVDLDLYRKPLKGVLIRTVSPNLRTFHNPIKFSILDSLPQLSNLSVNLTVPFRIENSQYHRHATLNDSSYTGIAQMGNNEWESGLNKNQIESLSITYNHYDQFRKGQVSDLFLKGFVNVKNIQITSFVGRMRYPSFKASPTDFFQMFRVINQTVQKIELIDQRGGFFANEKKFPWLFNSPQYTCPFPNLSSLILGRARRRRRRKNGTSNKLNGYLGTRRCVSGIDVEDLSSIVEKFPSLAHFECYVLIDEKKLKKSSYDLVLEKLSEGIFSPPGKKLEYFKCTLCWHFKPKNKFRVGVDLNELRFTILSKRSHLTKRKTLELRVEKENEHEFEVQLLSRNLKFLQYLLYQIPYELKTRVSSSSSQYHHDSRIFFLDASEGIVGEINEMGGFDTDVLYPLFKNAMKGEEEKEEELFKLVEENERVSGDGKHKIKSVSYLFV